LARKRLASGERTAESTITRLGRRGGRSAAAQEADARGNKNIRGHLAEHKEL
jgi:hypothetical protein